MSMTDAQLQKVLKACIILDYPAIGFVADPAYPTVTASNLWQEWYQRILWYLIDPLDPNAIPPGHRVFCAVTAPDWCHDLEAFLSAVNTSGIDWQPSGEPASGEVAVDELIADRWVEP